MGLGGLTEAELAVALHNAGMPIDRVAAEIGKSYFPTRRRLARDGAIAAQAIRYGVVEAVALIESTIPEAT